jgi:hypothetical protein
MQPRLMLPCPINSSSEPETGAVNLSLQGLAALSLLTLAACASDPLAIRKVMDEKRQLVFAFDSRFEGPAFGYVRGRALQECQRKALNDIAVLVNQTKTLNGVGFAEFWCIDRSVEGIPPASILPISAQQQQKLLNDQDALPAEQLPEQLR